MMWQMEGVLILTCAKAHSAIPPLLDSGKISSFKPSDKELFYNENYKTSAIAAVAVHYTANADIP